MARLWKFIIPTLQKFSLKKNNKNIASVSGIDNSNTNEDVALKKNKNPKDEEAKQSANNRYTEDISTIVDFLNVKQAQNISSNANDKTRENALKSFRQEELAYNSIFLIFNAIKKSKFFLSF